MAKSERFWELDGQRFLIFYFHGQNQTRTIVEWTKIDFFLLIFVYLNMHIIEHVENSDEKLINIKYS